MVVAVLVEKLESGGELASLVEEIPDAQSVETLVGLVPNTRLFVLSVDDEVIELVREAAESSTHIACARDLEHLLQSVPDGDPDVLIIDGANNVIAATIEQLVRQFPHAITIIIGTREESAELLQMTAAGRIFRFLLRPLSPGPVRLALTAAVARCVERKHPPAQRIEIALANTRPAQKSWLTISALAMAMLAMLGGGVWAAATYITTKPTAKRAAAAAVTASPTGAPATAQIEAINKQLAKADQAVAEGRITDPGGALELYRAVLTTDAENAAARAGIRRVADLVLERAEQAMVEENLDAAQEALRLVGEIDTEHPRLTFLGTQLARERERGNLRQLRLRRLIAEARNDIQSGNLLGWVSGGAVDALLEARKLDPRDGEVLNAVRELTAALADAVRKASAAGDTQRARAYTTAAVRLGVSRQILADMERALTESRQRDNAAASDVGPG